MNDQGSYIQKNLLNRQGSFFFGSFPAMMILMFIITLLLAGCDTQIPKKDTTVSSTAKVKVAKPPPEVKLLPQKFENLIGWKADDLTGVYDSFNYSCEYFRKKGAGSSLTGKHFDLSADHFLPLCDQFKKIKSSESNKIRQFFELNFTPYQVWKYVVIQDDVLGNNHGKSQSSQSAYSAKGLFTGYYESELQMSTQQSADYPYPIYGLPDNIIKVDLSNFDEDLKGKTVFGRLQDNQLIPYFSRKEILDNAVAAKDLQAIFWAKDPLELFILHIQGSGRGTLPDGSMVRLGYAGNNGHSYRSIAKVLIDRGFLNANQAGWTQIRQWMDKNPSKVMALLNENPRYIFFQIHQGNNGPMGSLNQPLTNKRSMAIDPDHMPLGVPLWFNSQGIPNQTKPIQRLMMAQDTGNAIKGVIRGDFFWGFGKEPELEAGRMRSPGQYNLLLPNSYQPKLGTLLDLGGADRNADE